MPLIRRARRVGSMAARQRGMSIVEMMVGIAIGLFIVAGATVLTTTQMVENRKLLLETQVQQDLRAAADIISRELRRAGSVTFPDALLWDNSQPGSQPAPDLFYGVAIDGSKVSYRYQRVGNLIDQDYRLDDSAHKIVQRIQGGTLQDITDPNTLKVTAFLIEDEGGDSLKLACPKLCTGDTEACWPTVQLSNLKLTIKGEAVHDATVKREVVMRVRVRNHGAKFNVSASQVCP